MVDIQEWIKNIETIEGEEYKVHCNHWHKLRLTLLINGNLAFRGEEEKLTLEGNLKLEGELSKVRCLIIKKTNITGLDLSKCSGLEQINVEDNPLFASINFLTYLPHPEKLKYLYIENSNFTDTTLDFLKSFVNLKKLKLEGGFCGSLEPLKDLKELEELSVNNTDIDSGLEYLNEKMKWRNFSCGASLRTDAKCRKLQVEKNKYEPFSKIILKKRKTFYKSTQTESQRQLSEKQTQTSTTVEKTSDQLEQERERVVTRNVICFFGGVVVAGLLFFVYYFFEGKNQKQAKLLESRFKR